MTKPLTKSQAGRLKYGHITYQFICDECGKVRSRGNHELCSKARQARYQRKGS